MFSIGFGEILLVLFLAIVLFGPKQIPDVMHFFKIATRCWQRLTKEFKATLQEERAHAKLTEELKALQKACDDEKI